MALFKWQKKQKDDGEDQFELPDELANQIKEGAEGAKKVSTIETKLNELTNLFSNDLAARKKREDDAAAALANKTRSEKQVEIDAEIEELMLTNPKEAIRKATENQSAAIMMLRADNIRREVFEDSEKFPYYTGDIKKEVDALIQGQSLAAKNDPSVVENCYLTVLGKHTKELVEGKIKARFAGGDNSRGTSSGSAGGESGEDGKKKLEITDDIRKAAKQVGIKVEDYAEMLDKEGII